MHEIFPEKIILLQETCVGFCCSMLIFFANNTLQGTFSNLLLVWQGFKKSQRAKHKSDQIPIHSVLIYCFVCKVITTIHISGVSRILVRGGGRSDKISSKVARILLRSGDNQQNFENIYSNRKTIYKILPNFSGKN